MAEDQTPSAEGAKEEAAPRKELEGFKVVRSAPPQQAEGSGMLVPFVIVIILALGGGFAAVKFGGDDEGGSGATTSGQTTGGGGTSTVVDTFPPDEVVPDYVWDRLEFLDGEGHLEKALDVAEEANNLTPNAKLRAKIADYRKELGLDLLDLTLPQALQKAREALSTGRYQDAIDLATTAIDLSGDESAEAYFIRGTAHGRDNNNLKAAEDLNSALDLGYEPAAEAQALLEKYE